MRINSLLWNPTSALMPMWFLFQAAYCGGNIAFSFGYVLIDNESPFFNNVEDGRVNLPSRAVSYCTTFQCESGHLKWVLFYPEYQILDFDNFSEHIHGLIVSDIKGSSESSSSQYVLASFGSCMISWILLCPCAQRRRKSRGKELSFRADGTRNPIIHRDVKPSNILLTEKFRAKVADFGFSRMGPLEIGETHVSTQVKGTAGYLDPEYLKKFQLTEKSDVYSFGILLLEIITGRKPIDEKREAKEKITIKWAFRKFLDGKVIEILDPRIEKSDATFMVADRVAELVFQCAAPSKQERPLMKKVTEVLWGIRRDYHTLLENRNNACMETDSMSVSSLQFADTAGHGAAETTLG